MSKSEAEVTAEALDEISRMLGVRVWRNNVGKLKDKNGRWVTFGLCPGSYDYIGIKAVTVTPEMLGQTVGIFTAVEMKREKGGRISPEQRAFGQLIREFGGLAIETQGDVRLLEILRP